MFPGLPGPVVFLVLGFGFSGFPGEKCRADFLNFPDGQADFFKKFLPGPLTSRGPVCYT
jgi:hypothetical protein